MAERLGEYITNEYGLLKHILSCLQPQDLRTAKLVCRDWSGAVETILGKNPAWLVYRTFDCTLPALQKPMLPSLVLYFAVARNYYYPEEECCSTCGTRECVYLCPCTTSDPDTVFAEVTMESTCEDLINSGFCCREKLYSFPDDPSVLFFPRNSQELSVSTYFGAIPKHALTKGKSDAFLNKCLGGPEPIKCLIILSNEGRKEVKKFIEKIVERQGLTFAVGGGITVNTKVKVGFGNTKLNGDIDHLIIAIRGQNVTAHSDVLGGYNSNNYQSFMQGMAERVGPLPEHSRRIAFLSQCVNRARVSVEEPESKAFKKAFPLVPQFGFKAYGEYGTRSCSEVTEDLEQAPPSKKKKMTLKFKHENTTSIVILTFKNVQENH